MIRLDSRTYIEPNATKELDERNRNVQMYVAIRYLELIKQTKPENVVEKPAPVAPEQEPTPVAAHVPETAPMAPEPEPEPEPEPDLQDTSKKSSIFPML